jgi:3-carboxy-cis,cis-muconate cycloisomerase
MSSVTDSVIFRNIFSTPAISSIWSDTQRTSYYLLFEASLASVQADIGIIPRQAADAILAFGHPVLGVVKQIVQNVNNLQPGLGEWAHWGATTQVRHMSSCHTGFQILFVSGCCRHRNNLANS